MAELKQPNEPGGTERQAAGTSVERYGGNSEIQTTSGERAMTAAAATAKALIQAKFVTAWGRPRSFEQVRFEILKTCKRLRFAQMAKYMKPQGGAKCCSDVPDCPKRQKDGKCHNVCGPSIRFADEAMKFMQNVDVRETVAYEDEDVRIVDVSALDLESNVCKSKTVTIRKVIERRTPREGQEVVGERLNSYGDRVFLVRSNDDELAVKEGAFCAKVRRNLELQLLPQDIIEDAMEQVRATVRGDIEKDPAAAVKAVCDAMGGLGVSPVMLEAYLGHPIPASSPAEIEALRAAYATIRDGQGTWQDFAKSGAKEPENGKPAESKLKAGRHSTSNKPQDAPKKASGASQGATAGGQPPTTPPGQQGAATGQTGDSDRLDLVNVIQTALDDADKFEKVNGAINAECGQANVQPKAWPSLPVEKLRLLSVLCK